MQKLILILLVCAPGCALDRRPWLEGWETVNVAGAAGADALEDAGQEAPDAFLAGEDAGDEATPPDAGPEALDAAQEPEDAAEPVMDAGQELEDASATDAALGFEDAGDAALGPGTQCETCGRWNPQGTAFYQTRECAEGYACSSLWMACLEEYGDDPTAPCTNPETWTALFEDITGEGLWFGSNCSPVGMSCEEWLTKYGS